MGLSRADVLIRCSRAAWMLLDSAPALAILNVAIATMPIEFLDFTVWIDSEGQELEEYEIQVEDENTVSCYIASEVGKEFRICWIDGTRMNQCVVACYMDGRPVGGKPSARTQSGGIEGVYTAAGTVRPFKFSPVVTTDDDDIADPDNVDPDLGCIQVEIHRVAGRRNRALQADREQDPQDRGRVHDVGPVHERSKKLGAHHVALGQEAFRADGKRPQFLRPNYAGDGPYAVFKFLYRPREILLARGIISPPAEDQDQKPSVKPEPQNIELAGPSHVQSNGRATRSTQSSRQSSSSGRPRSHIIKIEPEEHTLTANERRSLRKKARSR